MRWIGRTLFLLLCLAGAAWLATAILPRVAFYLGSDAGRYGNAETRSTLAYLLPASRDVEFVLARQPSRVRVAVVGLAAGGSALPVDATWQVAWHVLDNKGRGLGAGVFTGHCEAAARWTDDKGEQHPARWLQDPARQPCADRLLFLRLAAGENAARVRLRLTSMDPSLAGVAVRVAQRVLRSRVAEPGIAWQRMDERSRDELARAHPYPAYLLSPGEINAVTAHEWQPVGPQGVAGEDFGVTTVFYVPADILAQAADGHEDMAPVVADVAHRVTIPVHAPGPLTLRLRPLVTGDEPVAVQVMAHPTLPLPSAQFSLNVAATGMEWRQDLDRGLLEISAPTPVAVELAGADPQTLRHEEHALRLLRLADDDVAWPVTHVAGHVTAMRIDVRGYIEPAGLATTERDGLAWQWLAADGRVLRSGTLAPLLTSSPYDRLAGGGIVTEPQALYFRLPPAVATVRVKASGNLLAGAWTRLDDDFLPRRVPVDQRAWFDDPLRVPEWFRIDPVDQAERIAGRRMALLRVQHRPLPPTRLGPDTLVDVLKPDQADALAARLVLPLAAVPFKLAPSPRNLFAPVPRSCTVQLVAARGEPRLLPQLLFTHGQGMAPATILVDGLALDLPAPAGGTGIIDLPPLATGTHQVCINDPSPRRWHVNHAAPGRDRLIEGGGYWLEAGAPLDIGVDKTAAPLALNLRFYASDRLATSTVLQAIVTGVPASGASSGYTISRTTWTLPPPATGELAGVVLQQRSDRVAAPRTMNLVLDSDLPAGRWRIRFLLASGNPGYLGVSRLDYAADGATRVLHEVP